MYLSHGALFQSYDRFLVILLYLVLVPSEYLFLSACLGHHLEVSEFSFYSVLNLDVNLGRNNDVKLQIYLK